MNKIRCTTCVMMVLVATFAAHGAAAQTTGQLQVGAGTATDARGIRSNAITLAPSVTFGDATLASAAISGSATFFQNNAWALGGGAAATSRAPIAGGFDVALAADGSGSRTSYGATFATANLTPALEWTFRPVTVYAGTQAAAGYTAVSATTSTGPFPGASSTTLVSHTRWLYAPVYGARLRLLGDDPSVGAELALRWEPMHVGDTVVTDRTANAALVAGPITLALSAGQRTAPGERSTFGTGGVMLDVLHGVTLSVSGGRYPADRLTGAAGGNFMTAGLSLRVGGGLPSLPTPRGVSAVPVGATRLAIRAPSAQRVEVAGDWNDWVPVPAMRADNGVWYADLRIAPGQYRYAFRIDGHAWRVPGGAVAVDDGFGGKSAYVTVRDASATDTSTAKEDR
ncbi:MAG TPA: glycogen-binding domain-containing protein [Gemmatimonadaceae bacterium]|nr:glycogen-binding domain-containing protein [Gemmatimonadaceae bacterium]